MKTKTGIRIDGLPEAIDLLKDLPDKAQKRVLIRVMRKASRPVIASAKAGVSQSKTVQSSIKAFEPRGSRRKDNPILLVAPRISPSNPDKDPYFAHWIEGGTSGQGEFGNKYSRVRSKSSRAVKNDIFRFMNAKRKGVQAYSKGTPARPFMEPAIKSNIGKVKSIMIDEILVHITREASKMGKK